MRQVGLLALYGCKKAAQAWESFYAAKLEEVGFARGLGSAVVFFHAERDIACVCHGDDFTLVGDEKNLKWIERLMRSWFEIKVRAVLGPDANDDKEAVILGRIIRWKPWGLEYEADPKHRKVLIEHFGFTDESSR